MRSSVPVTLIRLVVSLSAVFSISSESYPSLDGYPATGDITSLFRSSIRYRSYAESELVEKHEQLFSAIRNSADGDDSIFVLKYKKQCGQYCHDKVLEETRLNGNHPYRVLDSSHGLIHSSYNFASSLSKKLIDVVLDFIPMLPEIKIEEDVYSSVYCTENSSYIELHVTALSSQRKDLREFARICTDIVFQTDSTVEHTCVIRITCGELNTTVNAIASLPFVQWIELRPKVNVHTMWANGVTQSGDDRIPILHIANFSGTGDIIGIADTGIDQFSCFFYDEDVPFPYDKHDPSHRKVVYYETYVDDEDGDGHGTYVAGTAAGKPVDGNAQEDYLGAAFNSKIAFFDIGDSSGALKLPSNINTGLFEHLYDVGAKIQSMSWGSSSNKYTTDARNVDVFMWNNPDALILVAAGNSGDLGPNSVGSPATSKNCIAVGASLNSHTSWESYGVDTDEYSSFGQDSLAFFSSRGPTSDGRLKPDLCAVGWYIATAASKYPSNGKEHCRTSATQGTSFSSPLLGGTAVLVREYFLSGYYPSGFRNPSDGFTPSGALIKALLINSARELDTIQNGDGSTEKTSLGDDNQGYGRVQINRGLSFSVNATREGLTFFVMGAADSGSEHYAELSDGDSPHEYTFTTMDSADVSPVRVTLAYTDFYGTVGAAKALVNDLDLRLFNDTHSFYPMITNEDGKYDRINNVEVIVLSRPARNATYTVTVTPHSISRTQPYALVITGEIGRIDYSLPDDNYFLYILGALLVIIIAASVVVVCICVSSHRKRQKEKAARVGTEISGTKNVRQQNTSIPMNVGPSEPEIIL